MNLITDIFQKCVVFGRLIIFSVLSALPTSALLKTCAFAIVYTEVA